MKLTYKGIRNSGELEKERIVFEVNTSCELGRHALFAARRASAARQVNSGFVPETYWFPDKQVTAGDLIVLYTKAGDVSEKKTAAGTTSHFFFWRRVEPIWSADRVPVIVEVESYSILDQVSPEDEIPV